jgi:mRNA interferase RelE/StbE
VTYLVVIGDFASEDLENIKDQRLKGIISKRVIKLEENPIEQGKLLADNLLGYYSIRAAGQRWRVIYEVLVVPPENREDLNDEGTVIVNVIGIRKDGDKNDAYNLAKKRLG